MLLPIAVYDDDLNVPINLAGITGSGTFSNWTVTDGTIVTTSTTTLTIPQYPIGNQLAVVSAIIGQNLGVLAGDSITFADPSGLNTMVGYVLSYVASTGAVTFQVGMTFQFEIRRQEHTGYGGGFGGGYSAYPQVGVYNDYGPEIVASLGNGILMTALGYLQILIPEVQMRKLRHAQTRVASMTMTDSVNTRQLFIAQLPMLRGGVTH